MLYKDLISIENLFRCWEVFKSGKLKKRDVMEYERHLEDNIFALHDKLKLHTYKHSPYTTFHINDPKHRIIRKATVEDRLVHRAVFDALYGVFDPTFVYHSYSSRLYKGTHLAVTNMSKSLRKVSRNYTCHAYVLKCDVKKFFQSVDHSKLLELIRSRIRIEGFLFGLPDVDDKIALGGGGIRR
jgi:RNA-directed DNA polymerase